MAEFTEDWFGPASCDRLAELAQVVVGVDGLIIEVGSWQGRSTVALANAVNPRQVHAVDHWRGIVGDISFDLASERDVFATFTANIAELTAGNVVTHRMGWREHLPLICEPIAFAFIDGDHSYREVFDNIAAYVPLMVSGAVICGDDNHHPPIRAALFQLLPPHDVELSATVWSWVKP